MIDANPTSQVSNTTSKPKPADQPFWDFSAKFIESTTLSAPQPVCSFGPNNYLLFCKANVPPAAAPSTVNLNPKHSL